MFDTVPRMLPARSNARMPVLPAALKKPPSKPTPNWSVSNHTDIGPLNVGVPERTGDVGLEPSPVMNTSGDNGSSVSRSEEHTSELQSLMRISYAVFCLKKKKKNSKTTKNKTQKKQL